MIVPVVKIGAYILGAPVERNRIPVKPDKYRNIKKIDTNKEDCIHVAGDVTGRQ